MSDTIEISAPFAEAKTDEGTQVAPETTAAVTTSQETPAEESSAEETPEAPKKAPKGLPKIVPAVDAEKAVKDTGLDLDAFAKEVFEAGELSADTRAKLAEKGIPESVVDSYVELQQAKAEKLVADLAKHVGGQDNLDAILQWGATGLTAEDTAAFNKLLASGDPITMKFAIDGLAARFEKTNGSLEGERITGGSPKQAAGVKPFESQDEIIRAMQDKKWGADSAYTKKVEARLKASPNLFNVHVS